MSVVEWLCDCCGGYMTQWDARVIWGVPIDEMRRSGALTVPENQIEDRCEDCAGHFDHCHEFVIVPDCARHDHCRQAVSDSASRHVEADDDDDQAHQAQEP